MLDNPDKKELLALTWSPKKQTVDPIYGLTDFIDKYFVAWCDVMHTCDIYPELNINGALHFHAVICIKDKVKWYKSLLPRLKYDGFVQIKTIFDINGWIEYLNKDKLHMELICNAKLPLNKEYLTNYKKAKKVWTFKTKTDANNNTIHIASLSYPIEDWCLHDSEEK